MMDQMYPNQISTLGSTYGGGQTTSAPEGLQDRLGRLMGALDKLADRIGSAADRACGFRPSPIPGSPVGDKVEQRPHLLLLAQRIDLIVNRCHEELNRLEQAL